MTTDYPEPAPRTLWRDFIVLPALAMCVGWGLRGTIGGGPLGAMIPGALVALCIARAWRLPPALTGVVAAFGAVGVGFGGQETYGQTVGFVSGRGEMFVRGLAGLGVKGAVWGLVGGAVLGVALAGGAGRQKENGRALAAMVLGTWLGWWAIDRPRLLYFSNLLDRPRPELWAGLLVGGLAFLAAWSRSARPVAVMAWAFAWRGLLGGGVGFALGGALYAGGLALGWKGAWFPGWKLMEFTFGLLLGAAFGLAAWRMRALRPAVDEPASTRSAPSPRAPLFAAVAGVMLWASSYLSLRFEYTLAGVVLLAFVGAAGRRAWQLAITVTTGAFLWDVGLQVHRLDPEIPQLATNLVAFLLAGVLAWCLDARVAAGRELTTWALRVLLWTAVAAAVIRVVWRPEISGETVLVNGVFVSGAAWVTWLLRRPLTVHQA